MVAEKEAPVRLAIDTCRPSITWTLKRPNADTPHGLGLATVNNKIYAVGGYSTRDPFYKQWKNMIPLQTAGPKADMPTPRRQLIVVSVNNKIYAIGGVKLFTSDPNSPDLFLFDRRIQSRHRHMGPESFHADWWNGEQGAWESFYRGAVANGKIYVAAHNSPGTLPTDHTRTGVRSRYKRADDKTQPPFSYTRYTVASLHDKVYALSDIGELAKYDPLKDSWIIRPSSTHRFRTGLASAGGKLFSIGGAQTPPLSVPWKSMILRPTTGP